MKTCNNGFLINVNVKNTFKWRVNRSNAGTKEGKEMHTSRNTIQLVIELEWRQP